MFVQHVDLEHAAKKFFNDTFHTVDVSDLQY